MLPKSMACDHELLRRSLGESLSEDLEDQLTVHLSECETCQRELQQLAGGDDEWSKVSEALRQSATMLSGFISSETTRTAKTEFGPDDDEATDDFLLDFAVDFLSPASTPGALGRIGEIEVLEVIGRGGMGVVLKGYQAELKRLVAVKVLAPHLAVSGPARQRFAREAQATAAILHPNVVPILTVHSTGKLPYLIMPFLSCESLQQRITRQGALDLEDVLRIGMQTAQGLAAAHAQGIVHRDVKPANILLEKGVDRVVLTDFGLARAIDDSSITRTGLIAGTPEYMSPEQARGESLDPRSDLFSLGSVLYTISTGRPPFRAESTYGILRRITDTKPRPIRDVNPRMPDWLVAIIEKMLAKSPAERFASAAMVASLLEQCLAHVQQPTVTPLPDFCVRPSRWNLMSRRWIAVIGVTLFVLLPIGIWTGQAIALRKVPNAPSHDGNFVPSTPVGEADSTTPALVLPSQSLPKESDLQWDSIETAIDQLDQNGAAFESRVDRFWESAPTPMFQEPPPNSKPLPEMESKP